MRYLLAVIALSFYASAQTLIPTDAPNTITAGSTTTVTLTYTAAGASPASGLEWVSTVPAGATITWTAGAALTAASKTMTCSMDGLTCLGYDLTTNTIGSGVIATGTLTVPAKGAQTFTITTALGASATGTSIPMMGGAVGILATSPYDLNQDGLVNVADLFIAAQQAAGVLPCTTAAFDAGHCDIVAVLKLVADALSATP